jgi:hypothetical protein
MSGKDLDALAKGLAEERISRGKALKRMGAVLFGGLLASAPMTAAFAQSRAEACAEAGGQCCGPGCKACCRTPQTRCVSTTGSRQQCVRFAPPR